jgi:hypothetical protein
LWNVVYNDIAFIEWAARFDGLAVHRNVAALDRGRNGGARCARKASDDDVGAKARFVSADGVLQTTK